MEYPLTNDVLEYIYSPDVRSRFEELVEGFRQAAAERGTLDAPEADLELVDRIHHSPERRAFTRQVRAENQARLPLFDQAVSAILEHAAAIHGYRPSQIRREDFSEFLFTCDRESHTYRRRVLVPESPGQSGRSVQPAQSKASLSPTRIRIDRADILYSHGDETIDDHGKLRCGTCTKKTDGIPLSRVHLIRERHFEARIEECLRAVFLETYEATKKKSHETRGTFDARIIDAVREQYPTVHNGVINWRQLYDVFENITRRNIAPEIVFADLPSHLRDSLTLSIAHNVPAPVCAARSRQKYDLRLAYKALLYVSRHIVYDILHRDGRTNPITKPFDLYATRDVFGSVPECYRLLDSLEHDSRFRPIPHTTKDRIRAPTETSYQSLHAGLWFCTSSGEIPLELQVRTHAMDARAEYRDDKQGHDAREVKFVTALRRVCASWLEPLFITLLAPDEHTRRMRTYQQGAGHSTSQLRS